MGQRVTPPDPRPEGRGPKLFFDFLGRELTFFRNSLQGEGREWEKETRCGKGLGPGTRERQHASRDTIPERWGERTHPRTQAHLNLNCSALAAARLQLPTLASGVGKLPFANGSLYVGELPTRAPDPPTLFSLLASGVATLEIEIRAPTLGPRVGR